MGRGGARTKQTARRSTGGKAPRKQLSTYADFMGGSEGHNKIKRRRLNNQPDSNQTPLAEAAAMSQKVRMSLIGCSDDEEGIGR